jgi:hypothetical protein
MITSTVSPSIPGRLVDFRQGTPVASITASAASWRGNSMAPLRSYPILAGQSFVARGNGRFNLVDPQVGPRVGAARGTLDVWFTMGSGAHSIVIAQSAYATTVAPLITLGVNAAGQAVGSVHDVGGITVAAWAATTMAGFAQGALIHMTVAWGAARPISGVHHVSVTMNDVAMPESSLVTVPLAPWVPFQPLYLTTGNVTETGFDGEMLITQASI